MEEEQKGEKRATYGVQLIKNLANELIPVYGNSYSKRNLDYYKKFYLLFPDFEIVNNCICYLAFVVKYFKFCGKIVLLLNFYVFLPR